VENLNRFRDKTKAGTVGLATVAQSEHGLVFGEERAKEIDFWPRFFLSPQGALRALITLKLISRQVSNKIRIKFT